eukprot:5176818-Prymnesium_polylepis.1
MVASGEREAQAQHPRRQGGGQSGVGARGGVACESTAVEPEARRSTAQGEAELNEVLAPRGGEHFCAGHLYVLPLPS